MDQDLIRREGDSTAEKDFASPSFVQESMTTSRVQYHRVYLDKTLLDRISETMKDQISEIIEQIKAPAKLENDGKQGDAVDQPSPSMIRAKDVGDLTVNKVCLISKDGAKTRASDNNPTLSVIERLKDWKIEQKQRKLGLPKYYIYHHSLSGKIFRSKLEVVQFVLTETCPPKPGTSRKKSRKPTKRSNKSSKTSTSRNERTKVEEVISQNVDEGIVSNNLNDVATENQDPILGSIASTINSNVSSNHEELKIHDLMSTEEMLNEYSIAYQRGEL
ncbi:hypothetical protein TanjilG_08441 [Lupinus angustifolius]|uniref:MBD domain-containing protein n=1 Tax=Lupinus angustifolius TaxID=3871 RepID=A0A1J7HM94_LUPAN|nr:hypothetical protein TanjilG_08441 [Lupinus angustifolius]